MTDEAQEFDNDEPQGQFHRDLQDFLQENAPDSEEFHALAILEANLTVADAGEVAPDFYLMGPAYYKSLAHELGLGPVDSHAPWDGPDEVLEHLPAPVIRTREVDGLVGVLRLSEIT